MASKMSVRTQDHFKEKIRRNLNPLIEEQELLVRQHTTAMTDKAAKKLAVKIGAYKIMDALKIAEENLKKAQNNAQSFFEKKATTKDKKDELSSKFDKEAYRYDEDKITYEDCEEQIRKWAKNEAQKFIEKLPEGSKLAELKRIKRVAEDQVMEADAPSELVAQLNNVFSKTLNITWNETPKKVMISNG